MIGDGKNRARGRLRGVPRKVASQKAVRCPSGQHGGGNIEIGGCDARWVLLWEHFHEREILPERKRPIRCHSVLGEAQRRGEGSVKMLSIANQIGDEEIIELEEIGDLQIDGVLPECPAVQVPLLRYR